MEGWSLSNKEATIRIPDTFLLICNKYLKMLAKKSTWGFGVFHEFNTVANRIKKNKKVMFITWSLDHNTSQANSLRT